MHPTVTCSQNSNLCNFSQSVKWLIVTVHNIIVKLAVLSLVTFPGRPTLKKLIERA